MDEAIGSGTTFEGWESQVIDNGANLPAKEGDGFDFIDSNIPSNANFTNPSTLGTMEAIETDWKEITCP